MKYLQGQHILILGLGSSGLAMARWCAEMGADITVADTREAPANLQVLNKVSCLKFNSNRVPLRPI